MIVSLACRAASGSLVFPGAGEDADDREILQERQVHGELRHLAGDEADRQQAATPGHRPRKLLEQRAADIVEADVDAAAAGQLAEPLTQFSLP